MSHLIFDHIEYILKSWTRIPDCPGWPFFQISQNWFCAVILHFRTLLTSILTSHLTDLTTFQKKNRNSGLSGCGQLGQICHNFVFLHFRSLTTTDLTCRMTYLTSLPKSLPGDRNCGLSRLGQFGLPKPYILHFRLLFYECFDKSLDIFDHFSKNILKNLTWTRNPDLTAWSECQNLDVWPIWSKLCVLTS